MGQNVIMKTGQECHKHTKEHVVRVTKVPVGTNTEYEGTCSEEQQNNEVITFCKNCSRILINNANVRPERPRKRTRKFMMAWGRVG